MNPAEQIEKQIEKQIDVAHRFSTTVIPLIEGLESALNNEEIKLVESDFLIVSRALRNIKEKLKSGRNLHGMFRDLDLLRWYFTANAQLLPDLYLVELISFFVFSGREAIRDLIASQDVDIQKEFGRQVFDFLNGRTETEVDNRLEFLSQFFKNGSKDVGSTIKKLGIDMEQRKKFFDHPFFLFLLEFLVMYKEEFSFQIALILAHITDTSTLMQLRTVLDVKQTNCRCDFVFNEPSWYLCDDAEQFMVSALEDQTITRIQDADGEDLILFKFTEKMAGVVLRDFSTASGQIIPRGVWICPENPHIREELEAYSNAGERVIDIRDLSGDWVLIRGVQPENFSKYEGGRKERSIEEIMQTILGTGRRDMDEK